MLKQETVLGAPGMRRGPECFGNLGKPGSRGAVGEGVVFLGS